jgi:hypothetical protein
MKYLKLFEEWNYSKNDSIDSLIKNARKWNLKDFIEEYVYLQDFNYALKDGKPVQNIKKGDKITIARNKRDINGKQVYNDKSMAEYLPYKTVTAEKDYNDSVWQFIMDNTKEIQKEAERYFNEYKDVKKPDFEEGSETIRAYHVSPKKFDNFRYQEKSTSGQIGAEVGFFFFLNIENAKYYGSVLKQNNGQAYLYEVDINKGNQLELNGEDIGTNWGRHGELSQAEIEGYDTVLIHDADTGYGITDELVVFDDDNIKIIYISDV